MIMAFHGLSSLSRFAGGHWRQRPLWLVRKQGGRPENEVCGGGAFVDHEAVTSRTSHHGVKPHPFGTMGGVFLLGD